MKYLIIMRTYLTMMRINHESVMTESYVRVPDCNVTDLVSQVPPILPDMRIFGKNNNINVIFGRLEQ